MGAVFNLSAAFTPPSLTIYSGTFTTNNFAVTISGTFSASFNTITKVMNWGSSLITLSGTGGISFSSSTLTINPGTSSLVFSGGSGAPLTNNTNTNLTFYNVSFTGTTLGFTITGTNTFNNLSFTNRTSVGGNTVSFAANQTINGTLTVSAGSSLGCRTCISSSTTSTQRTLTCNAVSLANVDFSNINFAGNCISGGNVTGTSLGNCGGNANITFPAPKTSYYVSATGTNWGETTNWSNTAGGVANDIYLPLAQDTAVIGNTLPAVGQTITVGLGSRIGTLNLSGRTSNALTLSTSGNNFVYGDWIGSSQITYTSTGTNVFSSPTTQSITSAGMTFSSNINISGGGTVNLLDAFTTSINNNNGFVVSYGTLNTNGFNLTLSGLGGGFTFSGTATLPVTLNLGTSVVTSNGNNYAWQNNDARYNVVTGTPTIRFTSAFTHFFIVTNQNPGVVPQVDLTSITVEQAGSGQLYIAGDCKFGTDRKSTRLNSSHTDISRMPSSA